MKKHQFALRVKYLGQMLCLLWKSDKIYFFSSLLEILIVSTIPFINMFLVSYSIDSFTLKVNFDEYIRNVSIILIVLLLFNILNSIISNYNNIRGNLIGQRLYTNILEKCLDIDYQKLLDINILEKKELATNALNNGAFTALIVNFKNIVANFIVICGIVTIISQVNILVLIVAILVVIVNGICAFLGKKHKYNMDEEMVPINRKISYYIGLSTNSSTAKEVRLFGMKNSLLKRYKNLYNETFFLLKKVFNINKNINCIGIVLNFILEAFIYVYLGFQLLIKSSITIGEFSLYGTSIRQFKDSISGLLSSFADIDNNGRYLKDYFEFLEIKSDFKDNEKLSFKTNKIEIKFENVSYKYPNQNEYALKNVNLIISDKSCISLVGENGSGKTTFIKLLMRLCDPTEGNIYINGINIKDIEYETYLKIFAPVFQDFNLYAFSIKENVTMLGENKKNEKEVLESLKKVGLNKLIENHEKGIDTFLYYVYDENGIELSGGEGQRLATARALYKNSEVFVFDEPTAALDPRAEYEILSNFNSMTKGKTSIYISHRLSSCRFSDNIVVFKEGKIVEYGNHKALMKNKSIYYELYNMQSHFYNENIE